MFHTTNLAIISRFVKRNRHPGSHEASYKHFILSESVRISWIVIQHPGFLINEFARYLILIGAVDIHPFILVGFRASCLFRF